MSVLGTTVFKVPELGELGYKLDQANEAKRKAAQEKLEKTVQATGAEKSYADNAMGLTGIYKQIADAEYANFRDAAIRFEETGSSKDEQVMKQAAGELNYAVTAGRAILTSAGEEYTKNKANGFKDVTLDSTQSSQSYSDFTNRTGVVVNKNGRTYVKDGDAFVPAVNSTFLQSGINSNNSFILPRAVEQGKYVNFRTYLNDQGRAITAASTVADAQDRVNDLYENELNKPAFLEDVMVSYAISELGKSDNPNKVTAEEYSEMTSLMSNPKLMEDAINWYGERLKESVPDLFAPPKSSNRRGFGISFGTGTDKDFFILDKSKGETTEVKFSEVDGKEDESIVFDVYTGFADNLQGKTQTDSKQFKYRVVGMGVKDGKIYAEKESAEDSGFFDKSTGKQYLRKAEPMSVSEFSKLPGDTRDLMGYYFGTGTELDDRVRSLEKMLSGKAVSSQEENQGGNSTEEELRKILKTSGATDAEIDEIISGS